MNEKELRKLLIEVGIKKGMRSTFLKPLRQSKGFKRTRPPWDKLELLEKKGVPLNAWFYIEKWLTKEEGKTEPLKKASAQQ